MTPIKTSSLFAAAAALAIFAGASAMQSPQDKKPPAGAPPAAKPADKPATPPKPPTNKSDEADDTAAAAGHDMMAAMMPGPAHDMLAKYVGEYETSTKFAAPGMDAEETSGTATITATLGGRFFLEESAGTMMGQQVQSMHYSGYNNTAKQYEATWTWSMNTSMMHMTGSSDDEGKTIRWNASMKNEAGEDETLKITNKYIDADHFTVEIRGGEGDEGAVMEIKYTRKQVQAQPAAPRPDKPRPTPASVEQPPSRP